MVFFEKVFIKRRNALLLSKAVSHRRVCGRLNYSPHFTRQLLASNIARGTPLAYWKPQADPTEASAASATQFETERSLKTTPSTVQTYTINFTPVLLRVSAVARRGCLSYLARRCPQARCGRSPSPPSRSSGSNPRRWHSCKRRAGFSALLNAARRPTGKTSRRRRRT